MDAPSLFIAPETPPIIAEEWQHRFKVVKIVSKEPRKIGRWSCMDFNDQTINQLAEVKPQPASPEAPEPVENDGKSFDHLVYTVREEVVALKKRISELFAANQRLEYENSFLRAHASPETLNLLLQAPQPHT